MPPCPKKVKLDINHNTVDIKAPVYKSKPKLFIDLNPDYRLKRDRVLWQKFPDSRIEIEEKYGK